MANNIKCSFNNKKKMAWESAQVRKSRHTKWEGPPPGLVKVNFDAAVRVIVVTVAAVCRNHKAKVLKIGV